MASILKRPGRPKPWLVQWREPGTKAQCWKAFATKREAGDWRDRVSQDLRDGTYVCHRPKPFKEYAEDWLARRKPTVSPNTAVIYEWALEQYLKPAFGPMPIQNLTADRIERWQADLLTAGMIKPRTVQMVRGVLGTILRDAYQKDYLKRNPMERVVGVDVPRRELRFLTLDQVKKLCAKAGPFYGVLFLLLAFTGLRIGEAAGLQWADLDLERKRLVVRRQVTWRRKKDRRPDEPGWSFQEPKSEAGKRVVEIPGMVARFLAEHRERLNGTPNPHGLVFPNGEGNPLEDTNVRHRHFEPALKAIGLKGIRVHDFRRTFIALHVEAGTHVKQVQARVGHSKIGLTMDVYGKLAGDLALGAEQEAKLNAMAARAIPEGGLTNSDFGKHLVNMSSKNRPKSLQPARRAIPHKSLTPYANLEYPTTS